MFLFDDCCSQRLLLHLLSHTRLFFPYNSFAWLLFRSTVVLSLFFFFCTLSALFRIELLLFLCMYVLFFFSVVSELNSSILRLSSRFACFLHHLPLSKRFRHYWQRSYTCWLFFCRHSPITISSISTVCICSLLNIRRISGPRNINLGWLFTHSNWLITRSPSLPTKEKNWKFIKALIWALTILVLLALFFTLREANNYSILLLRLDPLCTIMT